MAILRMILAFLRAFLANRADLAAENVLLRQQLIVVQRSVKRPQFRKSDRIFLSWPSRLWSGWQSALLIVHPVTVVRWHRHGFRLKWRWRSRRKPGRPKVDRQIRDLIRHLCRENATWGAPPVPSELAPLGHDEAQSTVARYMVRQPKPPSQNRRTSLKNHVGQIAAIDFFTVPTISFHVLYVFLVLRHHRRRVAHFNVTTNPTARWAGRQIAEAFAFEERPRFMLRDRDGIYGQDSRDRIEHVGTEEVLIAPRAPWQNPYCEQLIGSVRRECLDRVIVLSEEHLRRILPEYFGYYHEARTHLFLDRSSPIPRPVCPLEQGRAVAKAYLGGLHHCYTPAA